MDSAESVACMPLHTCTSEEVRGLCQSVPGTLASSLHGKQLVPRKGSAEEDNSEQGWPGQPVPFLDLTGSSLWG